MPALRRYFNLWNSPNYLSHHPYPENIFWVIEYSNTSLYKDLGVKAAIYAFEGIPEYWVINLKKNILIVFCDPVDGKYQSQQEFTSGVISPLAFPDVARDMPENTVPASCSVGQASCLLSAKSRQDACPTKIKGLVLYQVATPQSS